MNEARKKVGEIYKNPQGDLLIITAVDKISSGVYTLIRVSYLYLGPCPSSDSTPGVWSFYETSPFGEQLIRVKGKLDNLKILFG